MITNTTERILTGPADRPIPPTPLQKPPAEWPRNVRLDWVYVRFVPTKEPIEAVHRAKKRACIAGPTVSSKVPKNWEHAAEAGIDAILTDYPLELRTLLRKNATSK